MILIRTKRRLKQGIETEPEVQGGNISEGMIRKGLPEEVASELRTE